MSDRPLRIVGIYGSPYSRKLVAALRYRRIPYAWIVKDSEEDHGLPQPRVSLLPQVIIRREDGSEVAITDSTPILRDLDRTQRERRVRPDDDVVALIDALLEDWADEWLTRPMFHFRWAYEDDIRKASAILPRWSKPQRPDDEVEIGGGMFAQRQIGRLRVVGSNETTAPVIEESYRRSLKLLSDHLTEHRFLLGARPSTCDFAVYGQLTQLTGFDPTPSAIALESAPRVVAWVHFMEDLSGLEPGQIRWIDRSRIRETLGGLLTEVGRVHAPFLLANAQAMERGDADVSCTIDGRPWTQQVFPYQKKCLAWLRDEYLALGPEDRADADRILAGTGCEELFA